MRMRCRLLCWSGYWQNRAVWTSFNKPSIFSQTHNIGNNANTVLTWEALLYENQKILWQNVIPSANRSQASSPTLLSRLTWYLLVRQTLGSLYIYMFSLNSAFFCQINSISSIWQNQPCLVVQGTGDCLRHKWYRKLSGLSGRASDL